MSLISSGYFSKNDLISIIKNSNYNVFYNSNKNYEPNYYDLINWLHEFSHGSLDYENNGIWKIKVSSINDKIFIDKFIKAWGNRSNNFSNHISIDYLDRALEYINNNIQLALTCSESIEYLENFIKNVFNNFNPWPTLIYFSKFISTFLPDLAIPFDTPSLFKIAREYDIKGDTKSIKDYIVIHKKIRVDIINFLERNSMSVVDLKELDNFSLIGKKPLFILNQTPLNRPIDKIYYSV